MDEKGEVGIKKSFFYSVLVVFLILIFMGFASAGFSDFWGKITGKATSDTTQPNLTIANSAPVIINTSIAEVESSGLTLVEGLGLNVSFNFTVHDIDGLGDLDNLTALLLVNKTGETDRGNNPNFAYVNNSCHNVNIDYDANNATYQCNFTLYYFDGAGTWNVNVSIRDAAGSVAANLTPFTVNTLTAVTLNPPTLNWSTLSLSDVNSGSSNDPIVLNNTGNDINLSIKITAYELKGEVTASEIIPAANFSADGTTQGCSGTALVNATATNITAVHLNNGNNTVQAGDVTSGQEQVFVCLKGLPTGISSQFYSSKGSGGNWTIAIES